MKYAYQGVLKTRSIAQATAGMDGWWRRAKRFSRVTFRVSWSQNDLKLVMQCPCMWEVREQKRYEQVIFA